MVALDVNDLVTQNSGELVGAADPFEEARMDIDGTARHCEGVQLRIFHDKEAIVEGLRTHGGDKPLAHLVDVALHLGMLNQLEFLPRLATELPADPHLLIFSRRAGERRFGRLGGDASNYGIGTKEKITKPA
jgi:hypothetical protein